MRHVPLFAIIPLTVLLLATISIPTHAAEWEALAPLPAPNGGCLVGVEDDKIIVVGGTNWQGGVKHWLSTVHVFDPATKQWNTLEGALKTPVAYGVEIFSNGQFRFYGGTDGKQALRALCGWKDGAVYVVLEAQRPDPVVLAAGGMVQDSIVIVGGMDDPANLAGVRRTTHVMNARGVGRMADYPGKPFAVAASAAVSDEMLVFGGMNYDATTQLPVNTNAAYAYSVIKNAWRTLKPLAQPNRGLAAVALDEQHVYLAGGYTDDFTADAVIYDVKNDTYKPAPPLPHAAMVKLIRCDDFIYCLGGEDKKQSRTDKCFRVPVAELLK